MGLAKRVFRTLPMAVKSPAVRVMKVLQTQTAVGKFYSRAAAMNVVELSVRGDYGVFTQSVADRTMLPTYATTGKWNHEMNERLAAFFSKDGGTYVDVGANIGLTLVPLAQNPNVDIIAFEPDPSNFHYLTRNVADNCRHPNVTLHQLAAFREKTQLKFELSPDNLGNHRIRLKEEAGALSEQFRKTIVVEAVRLDDVVEVKRKPLAVKIDTEGAESFVLEGGPRLLSEAQLFFTEIWPYGIARMGGNVERVARLIKDNFKTFHIPPDFGAPEMAARSAEDFLLPLMNRSSDPWFHFDLFAVK
jgi:FkbM family methyltransferase